MHATDDFWFRQNRYWATNGAERQAELLCAERQKGNRGTGQFKIERPGSSVTRCCNLRVYAAPDVGSVKKAGNHRSPPLRKSHGVHRENDLRSRAFRAHWIWRAP